MSVNKNTGRNIIINDARFYWCKLDKPVSPFGTPVYEVSIHLDAKDKQVMQLEAEGIVFKKDAEAGTVYTTLKRKAEKPDGSANTKVTVVDTDKRAIDAKNVGNGSTGKVKLWRYDWEHNKRKGTSFVLQALLIENLVIFKGTGALIDIFDVADDGEGNKVKVPVAAYDDGDF